MKAALLIFSFLLNISAHATTDYQAEALIRSYPLAAYAKAKIGSSHLLWGEVSKTKPLYGFWRAGVEGQSSGLVNSAGGEISLYPISFFGLYASTHLVSRLSDKLAPFDCEQVHCRDGHFIRQSLGAKSAMKVGPVFWSGEWKVSKLNPGRDDKPFADEQTSLVGRRGDDSSISTTHALGFEYFDGDSIGVLWQYNRMLHQGGDTSMNMLFSRHERGSWSGLLGLGSFQTAQNSHILSTLLILKWAGEPGLLLF